MEIKNNDTQFNKTETDGKLDVTPLYTSPIMQPKLLNGLVSYNRRKICSMGESKAGKTYLGGTFPGMVEGKAGIIECDGSLSGLPKNVNAEKINVFQFLHSDVNNPDPKKRIPLFKLLYELLKSFVPNPYGWKTLMLDGLTTLSSLLLDEVMWDPKIGVSEKKISNEKDPTMTKANFDEWGALLARLQALFSVIDALPMHFYCTAMVKRDKDENSGHIIGMPACQGSFRQEVGRHFDGLILLTCRGGKHYAEPMGSAMYPGGVRGYKGPTSIEAPTYDKIFKEVNFE